MTVTQPPSEVELEVSLFGPGIGESIVVHLGHGKWMVVDSCMDSTGETPVALSYLRSMNVDVACQVELVLITHWHDDHCRGVSQILRACPSAEFFCSSALRSSQFQELIVAGHEMAVVDGKSGVNEFSEALAVLDSRKDHLNSPVPRFVLESTQIYDRDEVSVIALSPSSMALASAIAAFANLSPEVGKPVKRFPRLSPNNSSVVLVIKYKLGSILLGADLEHCNDRSIGWHAAINSRSKPAVPCGVYKVAHHGSEGADCPELWTDLLSNEPYALLSPYGRGRKPLPSKEDLDRVKDKTSRVYCTRYPPTSSPTSGDPGHKLMREFTRSSRRLHREPGHVRVRVPLDSCFGSARVDLFNGAVGI